MSTALVIFQKDVRHLWPRLLPVWCLAALVGWQDYRLSAAILRNAASTLWLLCWVYLVVVVIQEEALPGHRQYWLTRPIAWRDLLLSKLLFLAVCGSLPLLVAESLALALNGISPLRFAPVLLKLALVLTGTVSLVIAAVAAVTEDLVQFLWGFGALVGAAILGLTVFDAHVSWDSVEWVRGTVLLIVVAIASSIVLLQEYRRRTTFAARCLLGCGIALAAWGVRPDLWHTAWALEGRLSARPVGPQEVTLALDPVPGPAPSTYFPSSQETGINLPVLVSGVPEGTQVVSERITARIEAEGGRQWSGSWVATGGLTSAAGGEDAHVVRGNGPYWEYVNIDRDFYDAVRDRPVRLHTSVALTLLGERQTAAITADGITRHLPGEGMCMADPHGPLGYNMLFCDWPGRAPERTYLQGVLSRTGQTVKSLLSRQPAALYSIDGVLWDGGSTIFSPPSELKQWELLNLQLETWQAVAHFDRDLDLSNIVLANYAVRRITDTP